MRILAFIKERLLSSSNVLFQERYNFQNEGIKFGVTLNLHALRKIAFLCKNNNIRLLVICHPFQRNYSEIVNEFCKQENIPFFDYGPIIEMLESNSDYGEIYLKKDGHYTAFANDYIARYIANYVSNGLEGLNQ